MRSGKNEKKEREERQERRRGGEMGSEREVAKEWGKKIILIEVLR